MRRLREMRERRLEYNERLIRASANLGAEADAETAAGVGADADADIGADAEGAHGVD